MPATLNRMVVDALKSRDIPIIELSKALCEVRGIGEVEMLVMEVDADTETVKIVFKGDDVDYDAAVETMRQYGTVIRSIDEISMSKSG
ncbi:MAG: DUF211 domain-containing protein [Candidatus Geothermarchaeales archaeon]